MLRLDSGVKGFLIDLDGTIYLGDRLLRGAAAFIRRLRENGRRMLFISNNSSRSRKSYGLKLRRLGVDCADSEIFTSATAAALFLRAEHPESRVFPLGTPEFSRELAREGVVIDLVEPDLVLLGFDKTITYAKIEKAYGLLASGAPYVATHPDVLCPVDGGFIPDAGCFIAMFREATGRTPVVVGKPSMLMARCALERLGLKASETAMVGDRLYTDMRMAKDAGLRSILVLSGETVKKDLKSASAVPDHVVRGVWEIGFESKAGG